MTAAAAAALPCWAPLLAPRWLACPPACRPNGLPCYFPFAAQGDYAVGQVFLPKDPILYDQAKKVIHQVRCPGRLLHTLRCPLHILRRRAFSRAAVGVPCRTLAPKLKVPFPLPLQHHAQVAANQGHDLLGWRHVPTDNSSLGPSAVGGREGGMLGQPLACPSCGWESGIAALGSASHPLWPALNSRLCCAGRVLLRLIKLAPVRPCPAPAGGHGAAGGAVLCGALQAGGVCHAAAGATGVRAVAAA